MNSTSALPHRTHGPRRIRNRHVSRVNRLAGAALFLLTVGLYLVLRGSPWIGLGLLLAPDLAALGFFVSAQVGVAAYNLAHRPAYPGALLVIAVVAGWNVGTFCALIWLAHIGMDRAAGYGLKDATSPIAPASTKTP